MHRTRQSVSSFLRAILLAFISVCMIATALLDGHGQNLVPPTAAQAAKMPQFAARLTPRSAQRVAATPKDPARLAHPPLPRASFKNIGAGRLDRGPLDSVDLYDNGPINGNTDAWTINFGFIVSDSFSFANDGNTITEMTFAMWLFPGDTLTSAELSITSGENGGTSYFDQTVNFVQGSCTGNVYGFNICTETTTFTGPMLNAGTYWVNLQNASVPSGDPIYWDENSGPSSASENSVGSIPSESFTVLGNATTTSTTANPPAPVCPRPQAGFHDLQDFAPNSGPSGVVIDSTGKFYGALASGGSHGAGLVYDFAQRAGHWFLTSLYSFLGGSNGNSPGNVIVGPEGTVFGSAAGGFQVCGAYGQYCGLIYEASPGPTACATAVCSWNETTIYQFTDNTDAWGGNVSAVDSAGNLYGISWLGGTYRLGAVFELSPTQGGWTETIVHNFTGGSDGAFPTSLLLGQDGNLYGTTSGGNGICDEHLLCGVVFQLVASGGGWTENVIYAFTGETDGAEPQGLIQDTFGNLYGFSFCWNNPYRGCDNGIGDGASILFKLTPSGGGWVLSTPYTTRGDCDYYPNGFRALASDAAGNVYASEGGGAWCDEWGCHGMNCGRIVAVPSGAVLVSGEADIFSNLTSDASGNLYGTTNTCGFGTLSRNDGMIWQYSP